jgi:hypothetical protein
MTIDRMIFSGVAAASLLWTGAVVGQDVTPRAVSCKLIKNVAQLQAINTNPAGSYCLANDIDAGSVANFMPLSLANGKFFGNGYTIRNLTINDTTSSYVGLFGAIANAAIQDLRLVNANITAQANGAWVGGVTGRVVDAGLTAIKNVHVSGRVRCLADNCIAGGLIGVMENGEPVVSDSSSSAEVILPGAFSAGYAGGAIGYINNSAVSVVRTYATGGVLCKAATCYAGGLVGLSVGLIDRCSAAGPVAIAAAGNAGGLVGWAGGTVRRSHALGQVSGAATANAGGLLGLLANGTVEQSYSVGKVSGAGMLGGAVAATTGMPAVTNVYWDITTSGPAMSAAGTGRTANQLRSALPAGFDASWAITSKRSYPFLNTADIDFAAPLATLVKTGKVYTFLPIGQRDKSQYATVPAALGATSLATVYTMIARAIGTTGNVALKSVKINAYWNDTKKIAVWRGPVTSLATLGTFSAIAANARLNNTNVIGEMKIGRLVLLRGAYTKSNGAKAEHWMLGTLYTLSGNALAGVIANDPWTGMQVTIDPATKRVVWPTNYPLANFKVDGYQPVTLN